MKQKRHKICGIPSIFPLPQDESSLSVFGGTSGTSGTSGTLITNTLTSCPLCPLHRYLRGRSQLVRDNDLERIV